MHSIRLASPWQRKWESADRWERVKVPDSVDSGEQNVEYRRAFNCPTGLDSETAVWLVVKDWIGEILEVRVNGHRMVAREAGQAVPRPIRVAVERQLEPHNTIDITLASVDGEGVGMVGPVHLELVDRSVSDSGG